MKYLDKDGLSYFWSKIKGWVNSSAHPVGTIYMTASNTFDPNKTWGGTWTKWADGRVPLAANSTYPLGSTGGANTHSHTTAGHTLTVNEMPSHNHKFRHPSWTGADFKEGDTFYTPRWTARTSAAVVDSDYLVGGGASHSHGNTGSSSNVQPYRAVHIWQRTA